MLVGEIEGFEVRAGEYFRIRAGGRAPSDYHTVLLLAARRGRLPRFYLQVAGDRTRLEEIPGATEIERYVTISTDESTMELVAHADDQERVRSVMLDSEVLDYLRSQPLLVESTGDRLLIHTPGRVVPGPELPAHVRKGLWLAGLLLRRDPYPG